MIKIENLYFNYENIEALKNLNLEIKKGEFIGIVGRNGCGKSTLAKLIDAIEFPSEGKIYIDDILTSEDSLKVKRKVGMVFQNPDNQIVALTVEEDVAFGLENIGYPTEKMQERIDWALEAVGLQGFQKRSTDSLSGGQKQRLAIAGIIALNPDYIILDEPTSMLDPEGREELLRVVKSLRKTKTIIYITHNLEEIITADKVYVMDDGEVVMEGKPLDVLMDERIRNHGLLLPEFISYQKCLIENNLLDRIYSSYEELEKNIKLGDENGKITG
jgi:energy-coupling factor transport system ATP-binding protein